MSKSNKKAVLLVVWLALLGGLLFGITHFNGENGGSVFFPPPKAGPPVPQQATLAKRWPEIVAHAAAPPRGNPHARYTLVEFGDFQCHPCFLARPLLEKMLAQYPKQINLIFVHCPFPNIHKYALAAAEASEVAAAQGKFWPMYDMLYEHQEDLEPGSYGDYAASIGLNKSKFVTALLARSGKPAVDAAAKFSKSLGILETPTLIVHDNDSGAIHIYVGMSGDGNPPGVPGIRALPLHPPWLETENATHGPKRG